MPIKGTEYIKDWGKKIPTGDNNNHYTQTNENADCGKGGHATTNIPGKNAAIRDYFDEAGNYLGYATRKRS